MHEEGDHATKNQLSGVLLQGDGLEERLEQWECILHDQHGRLLPQRLANGPLHHHHFAQIRRKEEAPLCEPTHVEKSATSKVVRAGSTVGYVECDVKDQTGRLIARAASTCMKLKLESKSGSSTGVP